MTLPVVVVCRTAIEMLTGGYTMRCSPTNQNGSKFVDLTNIGRDLEFKF